jgi:hypothetical protein
MGAMPTSRSRVGMRAMFRQSIALDPSGNANVGPAS